MFILKFKYYSYYSAYRASYHGKVLRRDVAAILRDELADEDGAAHSRRCRTHIWVVSRHQHHTLLLCQPIHCCGQWRGWRAGSALHHQLLLSAPTLSSTPHLFHNLWLHAAVVDKVRRVWCYRVSRCRGCANANLTRVLDVLRVMCQDDNVSLDREVCNRASYHHSGVKVTMCSRNLG